MERQTQMTMTMSFFINIPGRITPRGDSYVTLSGVTVSDIRRQLRETCWELYLMVGRHIELSLILDGAYVKVMDSKSEAEKRHLGQITLGE